jgi:hypothetical protein
MKSIHPYILIAFSLAIPSIPSWREVWDGAAIPVCTAIPDGQSWRDGTSRDSKPRGVHYLLTWTWLAFNLVVPGQGENPFVTCNRLLGLYRYIAIDNEPLEPIVFNLIVKPKSTFYY